MYMSLLLDSGAKAATSVSGVAECMGSGTNFIRLLPIGSRSLFKTSCKPCLHGPFGQSFACPVLLVGFLVSGVTMPLC